MKIHDYVVVVRTMRDAAIETDADSAIWFYRAMIYVLAMDYTMSDERDLLIDDLKVCLEAAERNLTRPPDEPLH